MKYISVKLRTDHPDAVDWANARLGHKNCWRQLLPTCLCLEILTFLRYLTSDLINDDVLVAI